jgi:hypothetical protein
MKLTFFTSTGESFFLELPSDMSVQLVKTLLEGDVSSHPSLHLDASKVLVSSLEDQPANPSLSLTPCSQSNVPVSDQIWTVDGKVIVENDKTLEQLGWPEEVVVSFSRKQR